MGSVLQTPTRETQLNLNSSIRLNEPSSTPSSSAGVAQIFYSSGKLRYNEDGGPDKIISSAQSINDLDGAFYDVNDNVAFGNSNFGSLTSGSGNLVLGNNSGTTISGGNNNILIGDNLEPPSGGNSNYLNIGNHIIGNTNDKSISLSGENAKNLNTGSISFSSGNFSVPGDVYETKLMYLGTTTNGTLTEIFIDQSSERFVFPNDSSAHVNVRILARRTDVDGESAAYSFDFVLRHDGGTVVLSTSPIDKTILSETNVPWDVDIQPDNTNKSFNIRVQGEPGKTIYWCAVCEIILITG